MWISSSNAEKRSWKVILMTDSLENQFLQFIKGHNSYKSWMNLTWPKPSKTKPHIKFQMISYWKKSRKFFQITERLRKNYNSSVRNVARLTYIVVRASLQLQFPGRHLGVLINGDIQHLLVGDDGKGVPQTVRETASVLHRRYKEPESALIKYTQKCVSDLS
jgi:hypothetical protein